MKITNKQFSPSDNYLCVATILELILINFGYEISRYEIGNYFGVNLPAEVVIDGITNYRNTDDTTQYGIVIKTDEINRFFQQRKILLAEKFFHINTISEDNFVSFVRKKLDSSYMICGYDYGYVYEETTNIGVGHVSIIVETNDNKTEIFDPGPRKSGLKVVDTYRLYTGIRRQNDGLWCIHQ